MPTRNQAFEAERAKSEPAFVSVTVTVKMTPEQRAQYATEYGLDGAEATLADAQGRIQADVTEVLSQCYWLREFTSYSVSKPA